MSGLPFAAPFVVLASLLWSLPVFLFPRRRRAGAVAAVCHLAVTAAITRPWTDDWYWHDGTWLTLVFGHGALLACGRLCFELSPLGARHRGNSSRTRASGTASLPDAENHPATSW
ncbi:hypothetical protein [Streptomyces genisteinicus]|uniref:Uncharacterized protein n=1 Tax=Streptomyces genisteinicus TaxID=2768068 RepID=A0A7H0HMA7_9ACTN|nr:hypothetical protein [Streptomyces genisteinicus]QNP61673.1 hypothetical protein IAG43_01190 [Streptomyces genisteinicus]